MLVWRRIWNSFRARRRLDATIDMMPDGFIFSFRQKQTKVLWSEIAEIGAGVRDNLTFDTFYVLLSTKAAKVEINELDDGFRQLENAILERWPQIRENWQRLLTTPSRQTVFEVLWRKGGAF